MSEARKLLEKYENFSAGISGMSSGSTSNPTHSSLEKRVTPSGFRKKPKTRIFRETETPKTEAAPKKDKRTVGEVVNDFNDNVLEKRFRDCRLEVWDAGSPVTLGIVATVRRSSQNEARKYLKREAQQLADLVKAKLGDRVAKMTFVPNNPDPEADEYSEYEIGVSIIEIKCKKGALPVMRAMFK